MGISKWYCTFAASMAQACVFGRIALQLCVFCSTALIWVDLWWLRLYSAELDDFDDGDDDDAAQ